MSEAATTEHRFDAALQALSGYDDVDLLSKAMGEVFPDRICVVSAFGAESAVVLDMVARIDRKIPILFVDTGKHFKETLEYRDTLIDRLRLEDVRSIGPAQDKIAGDETGLLHQTNTDACCDIRKVIPLDEALSEFDCWITGRKRFQGGSRSTLATAETDGPNRLKLNPLANWSPARIDAYFDNFGLPRHPLWFKGYASIGCGPCTGLPTEAGDARSGRWSGLGKTECGIHRYGSQAA